MRAPAGSIVDRKTGDNATRSGSIKKNNNIWAGGTLRRAKNSRKQHELTNDRRSEGRVVHTEALLAGKNWRPQLANQSKRARSGSRVRTSAQ